jgi:hypothetical protein
VYDAEEEEEYEQSRTHFPPLDMTHGPPLDRMHAYLLPLTPKDDAYVIISNLSLFDVFPPRDEVDRI